MPRRIQRANVLSVQIVSIIVLSASVSVLVSAEAVTEQAEAAKAQQILEATGIKGGLIVHVGCGDGKLTTALRTSDSFLVHGLDANAENIQKARDYIQSLGLYGKVSVEQQTSDRLSYADDLVNLIVSEDLGKVTMKEVLRVLVPNGVAYIKKGGKWTKTIKPRPNEIDEWTHFLHGADNNAVARDTVVGPPRHLQWSGKPKFARAHEQFASLSACVSGGGRIFYMIDEAPQADIRLPSEWFLVARDAFNGVILWKRAMGPWVDQFRRFRSGPASVPFRLVTDGARVFVTLGFEAPVSVLDAATGETVLTIKDSERTKQIVHLDGALFLLVDGDVARIDEIDNARRRGEYIPHRCRILRVEASSGKIVWEHKMNELVFPCTAVGGGRLFCQTPKRLLCLDSKSGEQLWSVPLSVNLAVPKNKIRQGETQWESPTLVVGQSAVYLADHQRLKAFAAKDGQLLWASGSRSGYNSPPDVFLINGWVWVGGNVRRGLDPLTGEVQKEISIKKGYMHPRCYRNKATERYMLLGITDVQFVDCLSGECEQHNWIRGACQYGIMPANGLLYILPDSCACNMKTKLNGLYALAAKRRAESKMPEESDGRPFVRGPAYSGIVNRESPIESPNDWPTYRHDAKRSGVTDTKLSEKLTESWEAELGGRLSSFVIAGGRCFVSSIDAHTIFALDADNGRILWSYTAGGRVDSPPTVYKGIILFGSADGWLYALRASDGELVWRLRAAPQERKVVVNCQLESPWPAHGSVLVKDDVLVATAGRSSYLDGGIHVFRIKPLTGEMISETVIYSPDPQTDKQPPRGGKDMRGVKFDVLSADGSAIYMRQMRIDFEHGNETGRGVHIFTLAGLLDDTWWHRAYWVVHDQIGVHWSDWWKVGNIVPSGRILSYSKSSIYGYGRDKYPGGNIGQARGGEKYQLFAFDREAEGGKRPKPIARKGKRRRKDEKPKIKYRWTRQVPLLVRAMVVAGDAILIAGPPDVFKKGEEGKHKGPVLANPQEALAAWRGGKGALLWAVSEKNGAAVAKYTLDAPPVFDGMAVAQGRLYLAMTNGKVICLGGK